MPSIIRNLPVQSGRKNAPLERNFKMQSRIATRFAIFRLCRRAKRRARVRGVRASVYWFGAYYIHPKHLAVIIRVRTDQDKARLKSDPTFFADLKTELSAVNYPLEGHAGVGFVVESHETVKRDFEGSWYYRFK